MKPGDVQIAKKPDGKAVVLAVAVWAKRNGNWIHIRVKGVDNSITTVTNNPKSIRRHPALFRKLRQTLLNEGCWPFGEEGAEAEGGEMDREQPVSRFNPVPIRGEPHSATIIRNRGD
jgi:hypothetical protein